MRIERLNNSNSNPVPLASRFLPFSPGRIVDAFNKDGHFAFEYPSTLVINQVTTKDEFVYRCEVVTSINSAGYKSDLNLKVYSKFYDTIDEDVSLISIQCFSHYIKCIFF